MRAITDFHSHILPGIDDGSQSLDESIALLQMEREQGVYRIIATPHFYAHHDNLDHFLERRTHAEQLLREEIAKHSDLPEVLIGAEVSYFSGMSSSDAVEKLAIGNSKCILVEMPFSKWTDSMYAELQNIYDRRGLTPIIAHLDRYINRFSVRGVLRRLEALPVIIQCNAEAFLDKHTSSMMLSMLKNGKIHVLGSDCHNTSSRSPNLGDAMQLICKKMKESEIDDILRNADAILDSDAL